MAEDCNVVVPGIHTYPFTFQIPQQDTPSSFNGAYGKIIYMLEARLSRSMRIDSKAKSEFNFVSKGNLNAGPMVPELMIPQHGTKDKKMRFSSGTVAMDVNIDKLGYHQGEGIKVVASIQNKSSREIKPKYCLYRKHSFFARGKRRVHTKDILKEVGDPIPPSASQTVTRVINIPPTFETSILDCDILKSEYRLRVYLDVRYAKDPEIKFPVVVLHAFHSPEGHAVPQYTSIGFGPSSSDFLTPGIPNQPAWNSPPPPYPTASEPSEPPPAYGMYPPMSKFGEKH
ncbi:arrestin domain-containing protein 3-like [Aplochiton taeniatus]